MSDNDRDTDDTKSSMPLEDAAACIDEKEVGANIRATIDFIRSIGKIMLR